MTKTTRTGQIKKVHAILKRLRWEGKKAYLVGSFSGKRTSSVAELTDKELGNLVDYLVRQQQQVNQSADKMRKKVIGLLCTYGLTTDQDKPDMQKIYAFVEKIGYYKKGLNEYTVQELPKLVAQMTNISASAVKAFEKQNTNKNVAKETKRK